MQVLGQNMAWLMKKLCVLSVTGLKSSHQALV
jgi:hypothetical protein